MNAVADSYLGTQLSPHKVRSETDGSLICRAVVARSGFQDYRPSELGIEGYDLVPVYRPREEVLAKEFLASLEGATITDDHPTQFVNPENHNWVSHGFAVNAARGPDVDGEVTVEMDLHLKNDSLIRTVQGGKTALSVGYLYNLENENGRWTMRRLRANHIAVCDVGRAGAVAQITDARPKDDARTIGAKFEALLSRFHRRNAQDVGTINHSENKESPLLEQTSTVDEDQIETEEPMNHQEILDALNASNATMKRMFDDFKTLMDKRAAKDGECNCGAKKSHSDSCPMYAERAEDMDENFGERNQNRRGPDLISANSNGGGEGNYNPTARDCEVALNNLRAIRRVVADSGDRRVIDSYNAAILDIKRQLADALMRGPERVGPSPALQAMDDARESGADFEEQCRNFHRAEIPKSQEELSAVAKKRTTKATARRAVDANQREICEGYEDSVKAARTRALAKK
jgi:hypothetical protein